MNILYLHAHDAGRMCQPYGWPVQTPHLMQFAREGVLFRNAFCAAPTCGPSRSALLTGSYPHQHGMFGLPGAQGWVIDDYRKHLARILGERGYETALCGVQHEAPHQDFSALGYHRILEGEDPALPPECLGQWQPDSVARAERYLAEKARDRSKPFFLSVGVDEPHRDNFPRPELNLHGASDRFSKTRYYDPKRLDSRYTAPLPWLPDDPAVCQDVESFWEGMRIFDEQAGRILAALDHQGLRDDTLVIITTDHGIEFPGGKMTLSDHGTGVMLLLRGPGGFSGGQVHRALVSHLDVLPTLFDLLGIEPPFPLEGHSLLPLVRGEANQVCGALFTEQNYHGAAEPLRAIRTTRYKLIRRPAGGPPILRQDGPTTRVMQEAGYYAQMRPREELFDLVLDPMEACNRADDPDYSKIRADLARQLDEWMERTADPFPNIPSPA
jgi:N-sulfoglucosamine sulfohydrolase